MSLLGEDIHHAYILEGDADLARREVESFCEREFKAGVRGNPDVLFIENDFLSIDDVRSIREFQLKVPVTGDRKVLFVRFSSVTIEAQNALLKIFEEPSGGTVIFLVVASSDILIPTVRSRAETIIFKTLGADNALAAEFLSKSPSLRIKLLDDIIKNKKTSEALSFLDELERILSEKIGEENFGEEGVRAIESIFSAREYLRGRSPSFKMILEHLALTLPMLK